MTASVDLVVPTIGRASLHELLISLAEDAASGGRLPARIVLCDDRPRPSATSGGTAASEPTPSEPLLAEPPPAALADRLSVVVSGGRGPAAARNTGWRASTAPWIAFLDDDVLVPSGWLAALLRDLDGLPSSVAASQGRIDVPLPTDRRPTDWERNVAGLSSARWATADMAYRRDVLAAVGGFDERFPRAYREDADLGLRVTAAGFDIVRGHRRILHPVRPVGPSISIAMQAGNAEDPFMRALHGPRWRARAGVARGRRPWHLATVATAVVALGAAVARRPRAARAAGFVWAGLSGEFALRRIVPGPRTPREIGRLLWTSVVLPFAATRHWLRGVAGRRQRLQAPGPQPLRTGFAVLFDRDGTLVHDVPYNGDPDRVRPVEGAREAVRRLRGQGVPTAVITNQSGIARGWLTHEQVDAVNERIEELIGPLGPVLVCPHGPDDGCACRKPAPGLIRTAARTLGVDPADCVVIGDIASDIEAAAAAGARGILVPTAGTRAAEVVAAPEVAPDLAAAIDAALGPPPLVTRRAG